MAAITMREIDEMIETAITRVSTGGPLVSVFSINLYDYQRRITDKLVSQCISLCSNRGLEAERQGSCLQIIVNLETCYLNPRQSEYFNVSLGYARNEGLISY